MSRKIIFSLCVLLCGALIALNGEAAEAARSGFALWQNSVMPALLPFFVCTGLMRKLGLISLGNPAALMALSFISGAPGGARLCAGIYGNSTQDNTVMAASLNALSPMFITGAFASSMLRCPQAAIPIVSAQLIAMLVFFIVALRTTPMPTRIEARDEKVNAGVLFAASVTEAAASLISICGMIVFFSVLMRMLEITGLLSIIAWPLKQLILLLNGPGHAAEVMICAAVEAATGEPHSRCCAQLTGSHGACRIRVLFRRALHNGAEHDIHAYRYKEVSDMQAGAGHTCRADSIFIIPILLQWYAKCYRRAGNNGNIRAKQPFRPCYTCLLDGGNGSGNAYLRRKSKVGKAEKRRY